MPIRRRLILLGVLAVAGGALFSPFVSAGIRASHAESTPPPFLLAFYFAAGSGLAATACAWGGLRFADRAQLSMPLLRGWELGTSTPPGTFGRIVAVSLVVGGLVGIGLIPLLHFLHTPANPGSLEVRLLTVFFAATIPEIVVHLFAMSGLVLLFRKTWPAILLSSVLFVAIFHGGSVGDARTTAFVLGANFAFGMLTGWLYKCYGFEAAVLTHAVGHVIVVGWN